MKIMDIKYCADTVVFFETYSIGIIPASSRDIRRFTIENDVRALYYYYYLFKYVNY